MREQELKYDEPARWRSLPKPGRVLPISPWAKGTSPTTPLLVVIGEWDQEAFLEPQMRKTFMAWHPNAELVTIKNCGHCPMQETPVYLSTLIQKFMKENA